MDGEKVGNVEGSRLFVDSVRFGTRSVGWSAGGQHARVRWRPEALPCTVGRHGWAASAELQIQGGSRVCRLAIALAITPRALVRIEHSDA